MLILLFGCFDVIKVNSTGDFSLMIFNLSMLLPSTVSKVIKYDECTIACKY